MLISFSGRTKQIFFLVIKLEPRLLLSWLQPRKNDCVPTELDVSILAIVKFNLFYLLKMPYFCRIDSGLIFHSSDIKKRRMMKQWIFCFLHKRFHPMFGWANRCIKIQPQSKNSPPKMKEKSRINRKSYF